MKPMFLCSKLAEANAPSQGCTAQCEPAAPSQAKTARPPCCMCFVPETEGGDHRDRSFRITVERRTQRALDRLACWAWESQHPLLFKQGKEIRGESKPVRQSTGARTLNPGQQTHYLWRAGWGAGSFLCPPSSDTEPSG